MNVFRTGYHGLDWNSIYLDEGNEPLCGWPWLDQHRYDHTRAEIDGLGIEVSINGRAYAIVEAGNTKARTIVKEIVTLNK